MTSLYEEVGGNDGIEQLVTSFYQNVLSDPLLKPFFDGVSIDRLRRMQSAFFAVALGGPDLKHETDLYQIHQNLGIQVRHLTRFTEHLLATLKEVGIEEERAKRIYQRIATYAGDILGESNVDG